MIGSPRTGGGNTASARCRGGQVAAKLLRQGRDDVLARIEDAVTGDEVEIGSLGIYDQVLGWSARRCR